MTMDENNRVCLRRPAGMASNVSKSGMMDDVVVCKISANELSCLVQLDKTRAPEELANGKQDYIHRDKADVWIMGNIMYYMLTKKWLFEGITDRDAKKMIVAGETSKIPPEILNSTDPADKAMVKAIQMAWVHDPNQRPTARHISNFLRGQLEALHGGKKDELWRVSVPPLPPNHRYTDSDFYNNLQFNE